MYECPRCKYKCDTSTIFKRHLSKKKIYAVQYYVI